MLLEAACDARGVSSTRHARTRVGRRGGVFVCAAAAGCGRLARSFFSVRSRILRNRATFRVPRWALHRKVRLMPLLDVHCASFHS
jgi:hypothetical protein